MPTLTDESRIAAIVELRKLGWHEHHATVGVSARFACEYCDRDLLASIENYDTWQLDHIIPSSQHGSDEIANKALACKTCNFMKGWFVPDGDSRESRITNARRYIAERRVSKTAELERIRKIAGYESRDAA